MVRVPCCENMGLKKGPWTPEEDHILISFITQYGHPNWRALPKQAGLLRCGKSCRLRWTNYLRPDIKRGNFSKEEEETIIKLHQTLGNRWSAIATRLPGRTDNEIKNYWHTRLKKRAEVHEPKILRCSLLQTPVFCTSSSNHLQNNFQNNFCFVRRVDRAENMFMSLDPRVIAAAPTPRLSRHEHQSRLPEANGNYTPETNGRRIITTAADHHELHITNKSPEYSTVQILSAGVHESILQRPHAGNDGINSDMVFWYNLFIDAGRSL